MLNLIFIIGSVVLYVQPFKKPNLIFTLGIAVTSLIMFFVLGNPTGITLNFDGLLHDAVINKSHYALYFTLVIMLTFAFSPKNKSYIGVSFLAPLALLNPTTLSLSFILFLGDALNVATSSRVSKFLYSSVFGLILANKVYDFDHSASALVYFLAFILSLFALFNNSRFLRDGGEVKALFSALVIPILILDLANKLSFSLTPIVILVSGLILNMAWLLGRKSICFYTALASLGSFLFLTHEFNSFAAITLPFLVTFHWMNLRMEPPRIVKNYSFFLVRLILCSFGFLVFSLVAQWSLAVFLLLLLLFMGASTFITKNTAIYSQYFYKRSLVVILGASISVSIFFVRSLV